LAFSQFNSNASKYVKVQYSLEQTVYVILVVWSVNAH